MSRPVPIWRVHTPELVVSTWKHWFWARADGQRTPGPLQQSAALLQAEVQRPRRQWSPAIG